MLVCTFSFSSARIQSLYDPLMKFFSTRRWQRKHQRLPVGPLTGDRNPPLWDFLHSDSLLCFGIYPTQSSTKFPHSTVGIPPLEGQEQVQLLGFSPTRIQCCKCTKPFPCQIKYFGVKDQHSEETWSIPNRPTVKQARQDLHNHFHCQRNIHVFIPSLSIPIASYQFCLITSNMSNTRFHYTYVVIFLKRNTENSDPNIPILPSLGSPSKPRQRPEFQTDLGKT